ncbi:toll/interleukin-1 receptor domain-containing protein [Nitrosomonas sp.]|uniref:toll/interleukin-1 receptor domain-containing protein n=1 Tax=Nitrosomonas sp. TaxID=42353 RepID=UPI002084C316|nr:toll/interleukin-1 receptor domain-containing protein [Nitrosomonas sp.]GJL76003.1 MAG: hypothetical protein NMNS02_21090 [Nitrosomonas sp.]
MESRIHIFLSYRRNELTSSVDIQARNELEKQCNDRGFMLTYDETAIRECDSLTKFMDDIGTARCVILFLSPVYFQSSHTLRELVRIHEHAHQDSRFVFPLRVTANMCTYDKTESENKWNEKEEMRNELCRQLGESNQDAVWQRISCAWDNMVFPYLDVKHGSLEESLTIGGLSEELGKLLDAIKQGVSKAIDESRDQLQDKLQSEVAHILKQKNIPLESLATEFGLDANASEAVIAVHIVKTASVRDVLGKLSKLSQQQEKSLLPKQDHWNKFLYDMEQLCGWLLIQSVDPVWWFHHEDKLKHATQKLTNAFALEYPPYIEVIVSRSLLQQARYDLDDFNSITPAVEKHNAFLFDAVSLDAQDIQLLTPIYKDLRRAHKAPQDVNRLLEGICLTAKTHFESGEKPIYYIVSKGHFELLQSRAWFGDAENNMAGYLQFVCCDVDAMPYDGSPNDEQDLLLEFLANILRLRNRKREQYD